jgi:sugar lactone lactonase YvrE
MKDSTWRWWRFARAKKSIPYEETKKGMKTNKLILPFLLCICVLGTTIRTQAQSIYEPYAFGTLAGLPPSSADGTGSAARFYLPNGVAVDGVGNTYVADTFNHTIRKITPAGVATTLAGLAGTSGSADGTGSAARFSSPFGVAVDSAGNVYVADYANCTIRKITSAGVVTTFAGLAGQFGSVDGTGSAARFNLPQGVAVDSVGNVYVSDSYNYTIRKITPAAVVTTLAGQAGSSGSADGFGEGARFNHPVGITVDSAGNLYVADTFNHTIRKVTAVGTVTTLAGLAGSSGSADGIGSSARFYFPYGVTVDSAGNLYVADSNNYTIRKITPATAVTTLAGLAGSFGSVDGTGSAARFHSPDGVAVDSAGNVYVADSANSTIRKITPAAVVTTLAGLASPGNEDGTGSAARFYFPIGVAVDSAGNLYVADTFNHTIRKITPVGVVTTLAGLAGSSGSADGTGSTARFASPYGVAVDSAGNVYVADTGNFTIRKITPAGVVTTLAGLAGSSGSVDGTGSAARFKLPCSVAVDSVGNVYVADTTNHTIRAITPAGVVTTLAGLAGSSGSANGTGSAARFNRPYGVAVDNGGNVYVADTYNYTIRKITSAAVVTTLAGSAGSFGNADGAGSAARFYFPQDVALDSVGNVYVTDTYNHTIRKITSAGASTTFAGLTGFPGSADGTASAARFYFPQGVAGDSTGNVYVTDTYNNSIRIGSPGGPTPTPTATAIPTATPTPSSTPATTPTPTPIATPSSTPATPTPSPGGSATPTPTAGPSATATATPMPTSTPGGTSTPTPTAAPSATPSATPTPGVGRLANISTRLRVETGNNALIGGFIVTGTQPKRVILRAIGPSLAGAGVPNALTNPILELHGPNGFATVTNDNWMDAPNRQEIIDSTVAPANDLESAILMILQANNSAYTAIVRGVNDGTGVGLVEAYDLDNGADSKLANISTRGLVQTAENVMIGGFIVVGQITRVIVRAIGPSLSVPGKLGDPTLELRDGNGTLIQENNNWRTGGQETEIIATGIPPPDDLESAIVRPLDPGAYTVIVRGQGDATGVALVEVYDLGPP